MHKMPKISYSLIADNTEVINNITKNSDHTMNNSVLTCLHNMQKTHSLTQVWSQIDTVRCAAVYFPSEKPKWRLGIPCWSETLLLGEYMTSLNQNSALQEMQNFPRFMQNSQKVLGVETVKCRKCQIGQLFSIAY